MNHQDFIKKWTWKYYEIDNLYWAECVDLFKGYSRDVLWKTINVALWAAKKYYKDSAKWWGIKTPQPVQWDFAFTDFTEWGHVGIFDHLEPSWLYFWQFDQLGNWPQVWGEKPCQLRRYPISKLLGYVTYNKPMPTPPDPNDKIVEAFAKKYGIKGTSKTKSYSEFDTLLILSKILWQK